MAMNKHQAEQLKRKSAAMREQTVNPRTDDYGSRPGEYTDGFVPGDRFYDPDTNTWQNKNEGVNEPIDAYLDQIMGLSGMGGNVQGSSQGAAGSGQARSAKAPVPAERSTNADEAVVQEGLDNGLPLEEIVGGALGAGAAIIAKRLWDARNQRKAGMSGGTGADPAVAEAVAGDGRSAVPTRVPEPLNPRSLTEPGAFDAVFEEVFGLPPPQNKLPGPDEGVTVAPMGTQEQPQLGDMDSPNYRNMMNMDGVDSTIAATDDGSMQLPPQQEAVAKQIAQGVANGEIDINEFASSPDVPDTLYRRIRAILASM